MPFVFGGGIVSYSPTLTLIKARWGRDGGLGEGKHLSREQRGFPSPQKLTNSVNRPWWQGKGALRLFQRLIDVGKDVVDIFKSHGEADHAGRDARVAELLIRELTMRGAGGMQHAGADIRHMHLQGYELERIDETGSGVAAALEAEGNDAAAALR